MGRILCLAAVLVTAFAPAAQAADPAATVRALERQMRHAGAGSSAYVVDLGTGQTLYDRGQEQSDD